MISESKPLSIAAGLAILAWGTLGINSAEAKRFSFQFSFNDLETGTPVSGNFLFDDSVSPIVTPNGSFFGNASPSFSITVGNEVFTGLSNSIVVDSDFQAPSVPLSDLIIFDDFSDFNPQDPANNVFLGLFIYPPDAFQSEDLPATVPPTALATITTPTGETLFSPEAATSITAVPEPTTLFSLGVVGTLGAISVAKKTGFKGGKREN